MNEKPNQLNEDLKNHLKQKFIEIGKEWILNKFVSHGYGDSLHYRGILYQPENIANDFCKAMEEQI